MWPASPDVARSPGPHLYWLPQPRHSLVLVATPTTFDPEDGGGARRERWRRWQALGCPACRDPMGAALISCARYGSPVAGWHTPRARCLSSSAPPACCAPPALPKRCRDGAAAAGSAG